MLRLSNVTDELIGVFAFYAALLTLTHVLLSFLTGQARVKTKSFANPEDAVRRGGLQFYRESEDVERMRRIHRNGMENIPPFLVTALLYSLAGPSLYIYTWTLRCFTIVRWSYLCSYMFRFPAPIRSIVYCVGLYFVHLPMLCALLWYSL